MKKYTIQATWTMVGDIVVTAESREAAIAFANDCDLPEGSYVEDSFEVIEETIKEEP